MTTTTATTDPTDTTIHGPAGSYTLVFRGHRKPDAIGVLSAKGPKPYGADHLCVGVSITDGYTVANNDTFRRIMDCLGWEMTEVTGLLTPAGDTIWLGSPANVA